jgi:proteic killer suppression protein
MADTLADISYLPPTRCHELVGDRAGQFSLDLNHPYRLIIEPSHDPIPIKDNGGIDRSQVTIVLIIGMEDTHG